MTSTMDGLEILKQDARGRVWVSRERREALLLEFESSGVSAAKFAELAGIKYQTFANWVQKRRKERVAGTACAEVLAGHSGGPIRLLEAVIEGGNVRAKSPGLLIELPGGSRMVVESPAQLAMAAELVALIAQRTRC